MDTERLQELRARLELLDERQNHRLRGELKPGLVRPGPEELDRRFRQLAAYTLELEQVLHELLIALEGGGDGS